MWKITLLFLSIYIFNIQVLSAQHKSDDLLGVWLIHNGLAKIEFHKKDHQYFGKLVWLKEPLDKYGKPKVDKNNSNPALRNQEVIGQDLIKNLKWKISERWENGTVYDPDSGRTYSAFIRMVDKNTLQITGYLGFSFIGRTETWTRVK